jgi:hypothetical protein
LRKIFILIISLLLMAGCGRGVTQPPFAGVSPDVQEDLKAFLSTAAFGWETGLEIDSIPGISFSEYYVGDISGRIAAPDRALEVVTYGILDGNPVELQRAEVNPDGTWGPLTVLFGPKLVLIWAGDELAGEWLNPRHLVRTPWFDGAPRQDSFVVDPMDTALASLAMFCSGEYQASADILAALRTVHAANGGLPAEIDVFGRPGSDQIDIPATAWAGYTAALLAQVSGQEALWEEARTYASYLTQSASVPMDSASRLPGSLLLDVLAKEYDGYREHFQAWKVEAKGEYDPQIGLALVLTASPGKYVPNVYTPKGETDKWLHYTVLAALGKEPEHLEADLELLADLPVGRGLLDDEDISIRASAWMLIALSGKLR